MSEEAEEVVQQFTGYRPVPAEGARVGIMSCLTCGAAIVLDPADAIDMPALHTAWHRHVATLVL